MAQTWTLKRWSFNGHFWQRAPSKHFDNYEQAIKAAKLDNELGIKCELTTPDGQASEPAGEDHETK